MNNCTYLCTNICMHLYIKGDPGGKDLITGQFSLVQKNNISQNSYIEISMFTDILAREFWNLTAITHLFITKYLLKLAGICGSCNVNICT